MVVEPQHATAVIYKFCFKILRCSLGHLKKTSLEIDCHNHCTFSGDAMRLCLSFGAILFGILLHQNESQQWISRYQILSTPICEPWCWNIYIYTNMTALVQNHSVLSRFLYTSTILFAYGLYLIFNDKIMVFLMISHGFHRDFPWDFLAIFDSMVEFPHRSELPARSRWDWPLPRSSDRSPRSTPCTSSTKYTDVRAYIYIYYIIIILYYITFHYIILYYVIYYIML